jgi:hypothetical protein
MKYWHLRPDWTQPFREIEVVGPFWSVEAYYVDNYVSPDSGPFSPSNIELQTSGKKRLKPRDFLYDGIPPSCSLRHYELFENLISQYVMTFPLKVDATPYKTFRPNRFLDLIDLENSIFSRLDSGKPFNFRHIILRTPPFDNAPIFGISPPDTAWPHVIVNDDFKIIYDSNKLTGLRFLPSFGQEE